MEYNSKNIRIIETHIARTGNIGRGVAATFIKALSAFRAFGIKRYRKISKQTSSKDLFINIEERYSRSFRLK